MVEPGTYSIDVDLGETIVVELAENGKAAKTLVKFGAKEQKLDTGKWNYEKNILTLEWKKDKKEVLDFRSYGVARQRITFYTKPGGKKVVWRKVG